MAQPNNYGFGEEAVLLKESARKFFADNLPVDQLHALVADNPDPERMTDCAWREDLWQQVVELGWTMLAVPEANGGLGMPVAAVAGLAEELGRAAFPSPWLATVASSYVLAAAGVAAEPALTAIAEGGSATLALANAQGAWQVGDTEVSCSAGKLQGTAWFVQDARKVDHFLVCASTDSGQGLYWVASDAPGVSVKGDAIIDLTRDQAHVVFDGAEAEEVSTNAMAALASAMPAIWTLLAADMVGAAEWQLQTTVEYVTQRQQFDHALGFFQAVKHPLVDVMVDIDKAKSLVYNAACAIDTDPDRALQFAHMAKSAASDVAGFASGRSVQCHGGIGFTWECFIHLYFKRQKHSQMLFGDGAWHRAQLANILIGRVA